ncbi:unnamed protein product [Durusdinium trenchii]|uniref:Calpain catalytic domain-containing protein n=1 Tax=Durusdinium trenchii TaxID=1381693 RepID=A0ABP0NKM1_9DINO
MGKVDAESHAPAWRIDNKAKMKDVALFQNRDGSSDGVLWYWVSDDRKVCIGLYNDMKNEKLIVTFQGAKEEALAKPEDAAKPSFRCKVDGENIAFTVLPGEMVLAFDGEGQVPGFVPATEPLTAADYNEAFGDLAKLYDESAEKVKALISERGLDAANDMAILQACVETGTRFVDVNFNREVVMGNGEACPGPFLCPEQFLKDGQKKSLFVSDESGEKVSPGDVGQGFLGDCWLIAAIAALAEWPQRVYSIFGVDGNPYYGNEVGGYVVNHTKDGLWTRTIVDDFLVMRGVSPLFARNRKNSAELWVAILEKAWAKLHGGYRVIQVGKTANALTDLTGSPSQIFAFNPEDPQEVLLDGFVKTEFWSRDDLGKALTQWNHSDFAMNVQTPGTDASSFDRKNNDLTGLEKAYKKIGLLPGHCYTLYGVAVACGETICQIRNPWGSGTEWTGRWSDGSKEWKDIDEQEGAEILDMLGNRSMPSSSDGMFWMSLLDVSKYFKGGSVTMIQSPQTDLRFLGQSNGQANFALSLKNKTPSNRFAFMASQPDHRGRSGGSYAGLQIRVLLKTDACYRLAQAEDLQGEAAACRWRMSRDMGLNTALPEGEYIITLVTDANGPVVLSLQASGDFTAEAFGVPSGAEWLTRQLAADASFDIDISAAAEGLQQQKNKVPL